MAAVDWCPEDQVVLAREQVLGAERRCWRCDTPVIKRDLEQWFFRITKYADELLDFTGLDWPEPILLMQHNWIGRSEGAEIAFPVAPRGGGAGRDRWIEPIRVFTTRPDTTFGATFMVLARSTRWCRGHHRRAAGRGRGLCRGCAAERPRSTGFPAERERTGVFIGAR